MAGMSLQKGCWSSRIERIVGDRVLRLWVTGGGVGEIGVRTEQEWG